MPEVKIEIGGRSFDVACQQGEEEFLQTAARMLNGEAQVIASQIGRMPESRMLLMAGLMLADKTAGLEARLERAEDELQTLRQNGDTVTETKEVRVEVVPQSVQETLTRAAEQAEALAAKLTTQPE